MRALPPPGQKRRGNPALQVRPLWEQTWHHGQALPGTLTFLMYIPPEQICTMEAAAGFRLDSQLSAPRRCWKICGAGPPSRYHHIYIFRSRFPERTCTAKAAAGFRLDSQLSAPRRFGKICGAGPPSRSHHIYIFLSRFYVMHFIHIYIYRGSPGR